MFELLLRADRALSSGNLDQAERIYWQLSELDPTNAIAIAGLARVSLERGDVRLARLFATRALVMDPESVAATRIIETIDARGDDAAQEQEPLPEDLTLIAAQRLEALSHRRSIRDEDSDEAPSPPPRADDSTPQSEPEPKPLPELPDDPLQERRRIGRELAAAAAEMEAGAADSALHRRPGGRPEFHLTPIPERGRRRFEPEEMKAPPLADDPFAAAESEAVVEAVGEVDEADLEEAPRPESSHVQSADEAVPEVEDAAPASLDDPDGLLALRLSLLSGESEPEASEGGPSTGPQEDDLIAMRVAILAGDAEPPIPPWMPHGPDGEPSEEDAENEAFREAVAMVLGGQGVGTDPESPVVEAAESSPAAEPQSAVTETGPAESIESTEPAKIEPARVEPTWVSVETVEPAIEERTTPHRRAGFLRRIIGG
jgi:tetratricopeptide (TPR) repeat protein